MAPLPKSIDHFTHPGHPLSPVDGGKQDYQCDGCKTTGTGKRFRCQKGCDFDLHDYCATCPRTLSSFMHQNHALTLVMRKAAPTHGARQVNRICDVCQDPVEGLFYRCKECEFDVHPLCTQLPEKLHHAMHKVHPLTLQSSPVAGHCAVCRGSCGGWRYRCGMCSFDIHLECVLVPVVPCPENAQTCQRGVPAGFDPGNIPFQGPPQFGGYYGYPYGGPGYYPGYNHQPCFGPGFNMYYPNNFQNQAVGPSSNGTGKSGRSMFSLVGQLGLGVVSNMIFGVDLSSLFSG